MPVIGLAQDVLGSYKAQVEDILGELTTKVTTMRDNRQNYNKICDPCTGDTIYVPDHNMWADFSNSLYGLVNTLADFEVAARQQQQSPQASLAEQVNNIITLLNGVIQTLRCAALWKSCKCTNVYAADAIEPQLKRLQQVLGEIRRLDGIDRACLQMYEQRLRDPCHPIMRLHPVLRHAALRLLQLKADGTAVIDVDNIHKLAFEAQTRRFLPEAVVRPDCPCPCIVQRCTSSSGVRKEARGFNELMELPNRPQNIRMLETAAQKLLSHAGLRPGEGQGQRVNNQIGQGGTNQNGGQEGNNQNGGQEGNNQNGRQEGTNQNGRQEGTNQPTEESAGSSQADAAGRVGQQDPFVERKTRQYLEQLVKRSGGFTGIHRGSHPKMEQFRFVRSPDAMPQENLFNLAAVHQTDLRAANDAGPAYAVPWYKIRNKGEATSANARLYTDRHLMDRTTGREITEPVEQSRGGRQMRNVYFDADPSDLNVPQRGTFNPAGDMEFKLPVFTSTGGLQPAAWRTDPLF
jgi:hypothetical protein